VLGGKKAMMRTRFIPRKRVHRQHQAQSPIQRRMRLRMHATLQMRMKNSLKTMVCSESLKHYIHVLGDEEPNDLNYMYNYREIYYVGHEMIRTLLSADLNDVTGDCTVEKINEVSYTILST
jgi:hypothetical protein